MKYFGLADDLSPLCTKFFLKFCGTQKLIDSFFSPNSSGISSQSRTIKKKKTTGKQSLINSFCTKKVFSTILCVKSYSVILLFTH